MGGANDAHFSKLRAATMTKLLSLCLSLLAPMATLYQWALPLCSMVGAIIPLPFVIYFIVTVGVVRHSSLAKAATLTSSDPPITIASHSIAIILIAVISALALVAAGAAMNTATVTGVSSASAAPSAAASVLESGGDAPDSYGMDPSATGSAAMGVVETMLENLPQMVAGVMDDDAAVQTEYVTQFRMLLSVEKDLFIQEVIDSGVVPRFVEFLQRDDSPALQFEAALALIDLVSGTSDHDHIKGLEEHKIIDIYEKAVSIIEKYSGRDDKLEDGNQTTPHFSEAERSSALTDLVALCLLLGLAAVMSYLGEILRNVWATIAFVRNNSKTRSRRLRSATIILITAFATAVIIVIAIVDSSGHAVSMLILMAFFSAAVTYTNYVPMTAQEAAAVMTWGRFIDCTNILDVQYYKQQWNALPRRR